MHLHQTLKSTKDLMMQKLEEEILDAKRAVTKLAVGKGERQPRSTERA